MDISFIGLSSAAARLECSSVAGSLVDVQAAKTVRAMVAVGTACALRNNDAAAVFAGEHFAAGVCFVISFFKAFAFVFTVHG